MSMGADTKVNTRGGGALQMGDLRLLEDGSERGGALVSDVVAVETAGEERSEDGERAALEQSSPGSCCSKGKISK